MDSYPLMGSNCLPSTCSLTVKMTVYALLDERNARFYAGFKPSEMIEWE